MDKQTIDRAAARVYDNLLRADLDPSGNCFLAARAIQSIVNGGMLVEGRLNDELHVWFAADLDGDLTHWDVTAHGCMGAKVVLDGVAVLDDSYSEFTEWEWPEDYTAEFGVDLARLVRPNGGEQ
jgi:hypothetical protein